MAKIINGLEKFGLDEKIIETILNNGNKKTSTRKENFIQKQNGTPVEEDFLLLKSICCPICDNVFSTMVVKSGKARRLDPDFDLCPRFQYIDINKYDVTFCTKCGYAAMNKDISYSQYKCKEPGTGFERINCRKNA